MSVLFRIAVRNLFARKARTFILGGAIASVSMMMILMMGLTEGIRSKMIENSTALSTGHVNVGGFYKVSQSSAAPVLSEVSKLRVIVNETVPEAVEIVERVRAYGKIISDENNIMVPMTGVDMKAEKNILGGLALAKKSDYIESFSPSPSESLFEGRLADLENPGGLVLFAAAAKKLKVRVGDVVTISMPTYRNMYNTRDLKVVAILQNLGLISSFSVFLHHKDAREIYDLAADTSGVIQIYLPSIRSTPEVEERLRLAFSKAGYALMDKEANPFWMKFDRVSGESWTGQRLDITSWRDETSFLKWIIDIFNGLTFALTLVLMVIIVIGLVNNIWMTIRERTSEIGTLRALGLQRRGVLVLFLYESLVLAAGSVGIGLSLGVLTSYFVNSSAIPISSEAFVMFFMTNTVFMKIGSSAFFSVFAILTLVLMVGAFFPARKASKMSPLMAINHVN